MRLTRDDERARRICSLAIGFMNASSPVPSSAIARDFYPGLSADSFRRAFSRDRAALAACGVLVEETRAAGGESSWSADAGSFAQGAELAPLEAAALDMACQPLLEDPGFPLTDELRLALAKLTRAFAEEAVVSSAARGETRAFATLRSCLLDRRAARISYTDARGRSSERVIAPYGLFELRGERYLVAGRVGEDGRVADGGTRTYRLDRVGAAEELPGVAFDIPRDFSVDDWRRLPFQMGERSLTAVFDVPPEREDDLRRAARGQGELSRDADGRLVWTVWASSADDAASWAVAQGIRPVGPVGLVRSWRRVLEGVLADAS